MAEGTSRHGVFIASPNDVKAERQMAVNTVIEWNIHHWNDGITFVPLTYEFGTVSDIGKSPQQAIDEQLRIKADFLVAIFGSRFGTEIEQGITGTTHEISGAPERSALYFGPSAAVHPSDPKFNEQVEQYKKLAEYKESLRGYHKDFSDTETFAKMLYQQLDHWADQVERIVPTYSVPTRVMDITGWFKTVNKVQQKCSVLLYNVELNAMRNRDVFEDYFSDLLRQDRVREIVLLLPPYKIRRLAHYLNDFPVGYLDDARLDKIKVGQIVSPEKRRYMRVTTGAAFGLLRSGSDPSRGKLIPGGLFFGLTEPLSTPGEGVTADPEIIWEYNFPLLIYGEEPIQHELLNIWDEGFDEEALRPLPELYRSTESESTVLQELKEFPVSENRLSKDASLKLIKTLREKVFDPNVPSYLLDKNYFLLDWNPAFELVFPTTQFYRGEHVKEFVNCLQNRARVFEKGKKMEVDEAPSFDIETLVYESPIYGVMQLTKMASMIEDPETSEEIGWIVALNAASVEDPVSYENDLKTVNNQQSLVTVYASPFNKIIPNYAGYKELVKLHADAMQGANRVLDLGAGIGVLTLELLNRGKQVTAVDSNGLMLEFLRERCHRFLHAGLSVMKANIETVHNPNPEYDFDRIGIAPPYDGAVFLNVLHSLEHPENTLRNLAEEQLLKPGARVAFSVPGPNSSIDVLLHDIQQNTEKCWSASEWRRFSGVNRKVVEPGDFARFTEGNVSAMLENAGYKVIEATPLVYAGQGIFFVAELKR